jgi:hypothetical protein
MKIAALSDIHGNLFALDAVLADVERRGADLIVNLGDILSGPLLPRETADRLMTLQLPTIRGNHERQVLSMDAADMGASDRYAFDTITDAQRDWIAALPPVLRPAPDVFLCHATPQNDIDCYLEDIVGPAARKALVPSEHLGSDVAVFSGAPWHHCRNPGPMRKHQRTYANGREEARGRGSRGRRPHGSV